MQLWHKTLFANKLNELGNYEWKRLARNVEFDDQDCMRMHERHVDVEEMIKNINDVNEMTFEKCLEMLKGLERFKGGELYLHHLEPALKRINRTDVSKCLLTEIFNTDFGLWT